MGGKLKNKLKEKSPSKAKPDERIKEKEQDYEDDEMRLNRLDRSQLEYCKFKGCMQKSFGPHKHNLVSYNPKEIFVNSVLIFLARM